MVSLKPLTDLIAYEAGYEKAQQAVGMLSTHQHAYGISRQHWFKLLIGYQLGEAVRSEGGKG
jgi:hypothetical protein